ncbi:hypothetical protein Tsubulata_047032 [Turnera subulata]|uniref:Cystatin domain-containing protein n=1 Tax=Turnera subulata TaxID=218843 RepID=A0A9Q0GE45_9ROSI|nr:hypothetical protein Tsubulata_047032 [Turnera subulata]
MASSEVGGDVRAASSLSETQNQNPQKRSSSINEIPSADKPDNKKQKKVVVVGEEGTPEDDDNSDESSIDEALPHIYRCRQMLLDSRGFDVDLDLVEKIPKHYRKNFPCPIKLLPDVEKHTRKAEACAGACIDAYNNLKEGRNFHLIKISKANTWAVYSSQYFLTLEVEDRSVKGRPYPVLVYRVFAAAAVDENSPTVLPIFLYTPEGTRENLTPPPWNCRFR